ncbi:MAG: hypothetical protein OEP95_13495 [Myxococcales bacterium]|nr:hypothetical protein [Myxococcales bacterium]
MNTRRPLVLWSLFLLVALASPVHAAAEDDAPENVRIKVLTPAEAARGLRVFRHEGGGPMDRSKMEALMNRALDHLKNPDGTIEKASGTSITVELASGEKLTLDYDEKGRSWGGSVFVVVLPQ